MLIAKYYIRAAEVGTKLTENIPVLTSLYADIDWKNNYIVVNEIITNLANGEVYSKSKNMMFKALEVLMLQLRYTPYEFKYYDLSKFKNSFFTESLHLEEILKFNGIPYNEIQENELTELLKFEKYSDCSANLNDGTSEFEFKVTDNIGYNGGKFIFIEKSKIAGFNGVRIITVPADCYNTMYELFSKDKKETAPLDSFIGMFSKFSANNLSLSEIHKKHINLEEYSFL